MEIYTVQYLPEKNYELLGMVYGNVVTSKNVVQDIGAVLKKIVGGELGSYTKLLNEARDEATQKMEWEAKQLGGYARPKRSLAGQFCQREAGAAADFCAHPNRESPNRAFRQSLGVL